MKRLICKPVFLAWVLPVSLFAQDKICVTGAKVTEFGIYQAHILRVRTNACGVTIQALDEFNLLEQTTNLPARLGTRFGFRYEILGAPTNSPIRLTMVAKHPPFTNPVTGELRTKDTYRLKSRIGKTYVSSFLDEESCLATGQWTLEVWHRGSKLCEQSFNVVPDAANKIAVRR